MNFEEFKKEYDRATQLEAHALSAYRITLMPSMYTLVKLIRVVVLGPDTVDSRYVLDFIKGVIGEEAFNFAASKGGKV